MGEKIKYAGIVVFALVIVNCSVQKHYKTLSFFFDGVPNPAADTLIQNNTSIQQVIADSASLALRTPETYAHEPYRARQCELCHSTTSMGTLTNNQPELCYQCHDNLSNNYSVLHGPVDAGLCTECHNPHTSPNSKLLTQTGENLCFTCHDAETVKQDNMHTVSDEKQCISCHNPHGGDNEFVLRRESCYNCHDDFKNQYKILHGPVNSAACYLCHSHHIEGTSNLISTGQDICLVCHDKTSIFENENHNSIGSETCTTCHNPHGGDNRSFLY